MCVNKGAAFFVSTYFLIGTSFTFGFMFSQEIGPILGTISTLGLQSGIVEMPGPVKAIK